MQHPRLTLYRYLDVPGIESLHAQLTDRVEVELRSTTSGESRVGGKAGLGLGELFRTLLGFKLDVDLSGDISSGRTREIVQKLSPEQKLRAVIEYLERAEVEQFFVDLDQAARYSLLHRESVFVLCEERFNAPQFSAGQDGKTAAETAGAVFFERGPAQGREPLLFEDPYDYSDTYYQHKDPKTRVIMAASVAKFTRSVDGKLNSHDTMFLNATAGVSLTLSVFGYVTPVADMFVQIKPIAMS